MPDKSTKEYQRDVYAFDYLLEHITDRDLLGDEEYRYSIKNRTREGVSLKTGYKSLGSIEERNKFDGSLLYKGDAFERLTGRKQYLESRENNRYLWFVDRKSNMIKKEYLQARPCPLCASKKREILFNKKGFDHVKCNHCGFVFVSPILSDFALAEFYKKENKWIKVMLSRQEQRVSRIMYSYALRFLEKEYRLKNRRLLDIGSGSGLFIETAQQFGWEAAGIELNKKMIQRSRQRALKIYNDLNTLKKDRKRFAAITLWFVLEHIKNPKAFINDVAGLLLNDGLLLVCVPHLDALVNRLYGKESQTFAGHSHINFFNLDTLNSLVLKYGLALVAAETQITQLNNIKKVSERFRILPKSGLNLFLRTLTPEYIHRNMLGSNLIAVYRKIR